MYQINKLQFQVYLILIKDCVAQRLGIKNKDVDKEVSDDLHNRYHTLREEAATLKNQLEEVSVTINDIVSVQL